MKKYYLIAGLVLLAASPAFAQVKIGAAGAPDGSAMLEVTAGAANNKGILPPRMTTAQRNAITTPATGLMIYNTTANEMQVNTGTPASPTWTAATTAPGWNTNGNTGTTPATNFIGTTDNQPLSLRTNNTEKVRVTAAGNVGIGTTAPGVKLQVVDTGNVAITVASSTNGKASFNLGNGHHGISRDLTEAGGGANDVALYTTSGSPSSPASIHLGVKATVTDTLDLNQFVLKNTGRVGIGTNAPAAKLHIFDTTDVAVRLVASNGNKMSVDFGSPSHGVARNLANSGGLGNDVALYTSSGPTAATEGTLYLASNPINSDSIPLTQFALKKNGYIGIGTKDPAVRLHVNNGSLRIFNNATNLPNNAIEVINNGVGGINGSNNDNIVISSYGDSTKPSFATRFSRGTFAAPQNSRAGDNIGNFFFSARINGAMVNANVIQAVYLGDSTTNKSRLNFVSNNVAAMTIDSSRNVGIGTISPITKLHVVDTGDVIIRVGNTAGGRGHIQLGNDNHGVMRDLTGSGGEVNDVALFTSTASGPAAASSLYLVCNPTSSGSNNLPLDQFVLKNTGNVGIGTNAPTAKLSVNGTTNNLSGTWGIFSDARVKTIDGEYEDGLATVMKIHPVKFHYNANAPFKSTEQQIGIIAQEIEQIAPYMVSKINADGFTDLRQYNNQALPYMLVNAIQEQQAQIEALKAKNEQLEAANTATAQLMERVKQMEQMMGIKEIEGTSKVAGK